MDNLRQITDSVKDLFGNIPPGKRAALSGMFIVVGLVAVVLLYWAFRPQYRVLFSDLSLKDSADIVSILDEENIQYRLQQEGRRILVPAADLYATRLKVASQELPREHSAGWELFDETNLGVTDFVQKLNYRRGLEGELARTILQLDPVEAVRVHLVMPEESLFRENQEETMASVTLRIHKGHRLSPAQVEGVTFLVSSAVEGLEPENVTVVDSRGFVISEKLEPNPAMRLSASQLEIQRQVEDNLIKKGKSLLDRRFGQDRSAIQVTAELDFQQRELTRDVYDADNPSVRSEETTLSSATGTDTTSTRNENSITNYELNLTRERVVNPIGKIKRLSVAVMVDGHYTVNQNAGGGEPDREFTALDAAELEEIEETIRSALGFNAERGDEISLVSVPFDNVGLLGEKDLVTYDTWDLATRYGQKVITLFAIILMLLIIRNFVKRAQEVTQKKFGYPRLKPSYEGMREALEPAPDIKAEMSAEVRKAQVLKEQVSGFVADKPETAASLIRSWLIENP